MATFNGTDDADILNGTSVADQIFGNGGDDMLRGNGGDDMIRAGSGNDILEGGAGDDRLFADSGSNSLFGGDNSDILVSGTGSDLLNGGANVDLASWETSGAAVNANLTTGRAITNLATIDTLVGIENLLGSRFGDVLSGDGTANELFGGAGDDLLAGGGGNDRLFGGSGDDTLSVGTGHDNLRGEAGVDTVNFSGATSAHVDLEFGNALSSLGLANLFGIENVQTTNGADFIIGDARANRIQSLGGADEINGGEGDDVLIGGSGADTFVFEAVDILPFGVPGYDSGDDVIADFAAGDRIDLSRHFGATTFAELKAGASQFGDDTVLRLGEDTIRLEDVSLRELSAEMFLF